MEILLSHRDFALQGGPIPVGQSNNPLNQIKFRIFKNIIIVESGITMKKKIHCKSQLSTIKKKKNRKERKVCVPIVSWRAGSWQEVILSLLHRQSLREKDTNVARLSIPIKFSQCKCSISI